jgi:hypothetical protein
VNDEIEFGIGCEKIGNGIKKTGNEKEKEKGEN